jgi:hypothetical protein
VRSAAAEEGSAATPTVGVETVSAGGRAERGRCTVAAGKAPVVCAIKR